MTNPMFGMKFVTKASTPHTKAPGMPSRLSTTASITATMSPNTADTVRYTRVPLAKDVSASTTPGRSRRAAKRLRGKRTGVDTDEEHEGGDERHARERVEDPGGQAAEQSDDLAGVEGRHRRIDLLGGYPQPREPAAGVVDPVRHLRCVLGDQLGELGERQHDRAHQGDDDEVHEKDRDDGPEPDGRTQPFDPHPDRGDEHDEDDPEERRGDQPGGLPHPGHRQGHTRETEQDDQRAGDRVPQARDGVDPPAGGQAHARVRSSVLVKIAQSTMTSRPMTSIDQKG